MLGMRESIEGFYDRIWANDSLFKAFWDSFNAFLDWLWTSKSQL